MLQALAGWLTVSAVLAAAASVVRGNAPWQRNLGASWERRTLGSVLTLAAAGVLMYGIVAVWSPSVPAIPAPDCTVGHITGSALWLWFSALTGLQKTAMVFVAIAVCGLFLFSLGVITQSVVSQAVLSILGAVLIGIGGVGALVFYILYRTLG